MSNNRGSFGSYEPTGYGSHGPSAAVSRDSSSECSRLLQTAGNNIQKISQNVAQVQRMVTQVGSPQDTAELRDKLHQLQHYTNQLAKETSECMKELAHLPLPSGQSEQKQHKMQKERLMNEFTAALNSFQVAQRKAASKEKESVARARASSSSYDPFAEMMSSDTKPQAIQSQAPQQMVQVEEDTDLELIREREQAIRQLESDIMDVNEIFKDMGVLVHEQGEVIDSIEANVETAQVGVEQGTSQLMQARNYQTKARRKKCIIIIVILVILAIIGIIIGVSVSQK